MNCIGSFTSRYARVFTKLQFKLRRITACSLIPFRPAVLFCSFSFNLKLFKNLKFPPRVVLGSSERRRVDCGKREKSKETR